MGGCLGVDGGGSARLFRTVRFRSAVRELHPPVTPFSLVNLSFSSRLLTDSQEVLVIGNLLSFVVILDFRKSSTFLNASRSAFFDPHGCLANHISAQLLGSSSAAISFSCPRRVKVAGDGQTLRGAAAYLLTNLQPVSALTPKYRWVLAERRLNALWAKPPASPLLPEITPALPRAILKF
jgi:hypothetical protein